MTSQLADDILLKLLRNCYSTPVCHSSQRCRTTRAHRQVRSFRTSTSRRTKFQCLEGSGGTVKIVVAKNEEKGYVPFRSSAVFSKVAEPHINNTNAVEPSKNIAVIGGGITGLTTAYYLSQELPNSQITLYEQSSRVGGWMRTEMVDVGDGKVTFEQGPRTIRTSPFPQAMVTLELVKNLRLSIVGEPKISDASRNRFLYYPDHLVRMPGPGADLYQQLWEVLTEPVFKGFISGFMGEYWRPGRSSSTEDESVGSFLERRLGGSDIVENIASALLHGIYAGDIYQLSAKSIFPLLWEAEKRYGSLIKWRMNSVSSTEKNVAAKPAYLILGRDLKLLRELKQDPELVELTNALEPMSLWSFPNGISTLSDTLAASLKANPKVHVRMDEKLTTVAFEESVRKIKITTSKNLPPVYYDNVISTISGRSLSYLTKEKHIVPISSLDKTHSVTVMVVNLCYNNPDLLPVNGFGYLIPRSIPFEQNPERALGVIFDSALMKERDTKLGGPDRPQTRITVMLGGHWWDTFTKYPDEDEGAAMAKAVLKRHLKIEEAPIAVHVGLQKHCIPQYTVGHYARMKKAHGELLHAFHGKLSVAGNSYTGVGINDCVRAARDVAKDVSKYEGPSGITGLEQFQTPATYVWASA